MKHLPIGTLLFALAACCACRDKKAPASEPAPEAGALLNSAPATDAPQVQGAPVKTPSTSAVPREFLVAFTDDKAAEGRADMFARHQVREVNKVGSTATYLVRSEVDVEDKALIAQMQGEPGVRYVEPNLRYRLFPMKGGKGGGGPQTK